MDSKQSRKDIIKGVSTAAICTIYVMFLSNALKFLLPIDNNYVGIVALILFLIVSYLILRKSLPEGWPIKSGKNCSIETFLIALGIVSGYQAILRSVSAGTPFSWSLPYFLYIGCMIPIFEEVVFRGYILERYKKHGSAFAIIASSILFGMYHCNPVQLVTATFLGLMLGYVAYKYSIKYTIILHFFNNGVVDKLFPLLWNTIGSAFLIRWGTPIVTGILFIIGLICFFKTKPIPEIKRVIKEVPNEKRAYFNLFVNPWIIIIVIAMVALTALILYGVTSGSITADSISRIK